MQPKDDITVKRIAKIHPELRDELQEIYAEIRTVLTGRASVRFTQTLRTFEEQAELYAKGRTKPGRIVTNARAGQSFHNYGLAVDFCLLLDAGREVSWDLEKDYDGDQEADWMEVVKVFKDLGWEWGGDWHTFKDYPHFQKDFGYSYEGLMAKHLNRDVDREGYVVI